jgi:hypothetical protein
MRDPQPPAHRLLTTPYMRKANKRKLSLDRITIRILKDHELGNAAGGLPMNNSGICSGMPTPAAAATTGSSAMHASSMTS